MGIVLFDLDGTLTDPKLGITRCIAYALESLGLPTPPTESLTSWIGPPIQDSFRIHLDGQDPTQAVAKFRERFAETGIFENAVYDGISKALSDLREVGNTLILATSKPQPFAERILDHFDLSQYFTAIYGSSFDGTLSDKAELIAHIVTAERLNPTSTVMVGDRMHDILGAARNQIPGIGVLYGYGSFQELREAGAAALCDAPQALPSTIAGHFFPR